MGPLRDAGVAVVSMVVLAAALLVPGLGRAPLDDPGEGQHAEIAREMLGGSWITPHLNGVRYFDKPPLLYWLTALSFRQWGLTEHAARLAPLLGALLAVAGTTLLGVRLLGPAGGLLAGAALLSCALFAAYARYLRPETLFVAAIQWGFTGLLWARSSAVDRSRSGAAVLGCAALGVAALAKDPLGLVGPLAAVAMALWLAGRLRPVARWLPAAGVVLMLAIGVGWYAMVTVREPSFLWYAVVDNHVLNVARMRAFPDEDVPLSALEFLTVAGFGAAPWIVAAAVTAVALARRRAWRDPAEVPWVALAIWAVGVLAIFTLSPFKLPHYGLPAYPAVALLAARAWHDAGARPRGLIGVHLALFLLLGVGLAWGSASDGRAFITGVFGVTDVYSRKEAAWGQPSPYPPWSAIQPLLVRASVLFLAGSAALAVAFARRSARVAAVAVGAVMLLLVPVVGDGLAATSTARAVAGMAAEIRTRLAPDDVLVLEGPIENAGAVEFYSGHRPGLLDARRSILGVGATFADAAPVFWSEARFLEAWSSSRPPYLLTTRVPAQSIAAQLPPGSVGLLAVQNGRWLYGRAPGPR